MSNINAYVNAALEVNISRQSLRQMVTVAGNTVGNICVIGFNDYAKHLLNLFPDKVKYVIDHATDKRDISFRGVKVMRRIEDIKGEVKCFIITDLAYIYDYQRDIMLHARFKRSRIYFPAELNNFNTKGFNLPLQDKFYINLFDDEEYRNRFSASMMREDTLVFLLELIQSTLHLKGEVVEIGVWQGGSAYFIAKLLAELKSNKKLHLFDFFEELAPDQPKGIMCIDELKRKFSFYPNTRFYSGDIRKTIKEVSGKKFSFIHYDMGFQESIMETIVPGLVAGGIILFDNYGHMGSRPGLFDNFVTKHNLKICRIPFSEQAFIIKN